MRLLVQMIQAAQSFTGALLQWRQGFSWCGLILAILLLSGCSTSNGTLAVGNFNPPGKAYHVAIDPVLTQQTMDPIFTRLDNMARAIEISESANNPFMSKLPTLSMLPLGDLDMPEEELPAENPQQIASTVPAVINAPEATTTPESYVPVSTSSNTPNVTGMSLTLVGIVYHPTAPVALVRAAAWGDKTRYLRAGDMMELGGRSIRILKIHPDRVEVTESGKTKVIRLPDIVGYDSR